jgi:hypothetical protein
MTGLPFDSPLLGSRQFATGLLQNTLRVRAELCQALRGGHHKRPVIVERCERVLLCAGMHEGFEDQLRHQSRPLYVCRAVTGGPKVRKKRADCQGSHTRTNMRVARRT